MRFFGISMSEASAGGDNGLYPSWRSRELAQEAFGSIVLKVRDLRRQRSSGRGCRGSQRGLTSVEDSFGGRRHSQFGAGSEVDPRIGGVESTGSETSTAFGSEGSMIGRRMRQGSWEKRSRAHRAGVANDQWFDKSMVSGPKTLEVFGPKVLKVGDRRLRRPAVGGIRAFASAREADGARGMSFEVLRAGSVKGLRICGVEGLWD